MDPADALPPDVLSGERDVLTKEEGNIYLRARIRYYTGLSLEEFVEREAEFCDWSVVGSLKELAGIDMRNRCC